MKKKKSRKSISNSDIIKKKKKEVIEEEEEETLPTTESSETETEVEETNAKDSETEDSNNKIKDEEEIILNNDTDVFNSLVQMVQEAPEDILLSSSSSSNGGVNIENTLINNIQYLFSRIEATGGEYMKLLNHQLKQTTSTREEESEEEDEDDDDENTNFLYPFSGLEKLYISNSKDDDFLELLWSQVDLQNQSLLPKLKSAFKKKKKKSQNNNNDEDSDAEVEAPVLMKISDSDSEESDESSQSDGSSESVSENEDKESEDEETKRIRQRMERSMLDMDDMDDGEEEEEEESYDSEDEDIQDNKIKKKKKNKKKVEDFDPAAEELNDGFFDLNDMEDFADEEEDFHLFDDGDGDDNDDDDDDGSEEEKEGGDFKRKKKYREEEDIDALHSMYTDNFDEDDDDDDEVDPAELTAADFFGQPNKKYHGRFKFVNGKFIRTDKKNDKESGMKKNELEESWDKSAEKEDEEDENDWPTRNNNASDSQQMEQDESSDEEDEEDEIEEEEEEEIQGKESTTTHAKQQAKLAKQIKQYEEELLMEKPWQMKGETKATSRPVDSLLDSTPEFELANKQAPAITVEHTTSLEEVIKRRIIENDWDDIVPRELPSVFKQHNNRSLGPEVSQEKSKLGLGELYEREYLKKAVGYDVEKEEKQTQEDKAKMEMRTLFASLCSKLDAMSNYHFAPRPVDQEAERADNGEINVLANKPAISVEDIIPTFVSDKRTLVPKDIYKGTGNLRGKDSVLKGESELSQQDRQRARQTKKSKRRKERKEKLADERILSKLNPLSTGLNNPYEKRKIREDLSFARSRGKIITAEENPNSSNYNSSTKFFKELQDSTRSEIRNNYDDGNDSNKRRKVGDDSAKSSSYKL